MTTFLVSGLINLETTCAVDGWPVAYQPVRYAFGGVNATISGVGYNVATALHTLGAEVHLCALIGTDLAGDMARHAVRQAGLDDCWTLATRPHTAHSVITYEPSGRRAIAVDLKDLQEAAYPPATFDEARRGCDWAILCNINYSRALLSVAQQAGLPIATDVHTLSDLDDAYNGDFLRAAQVLFLSHERVAGTPTDFLRALVQRYAPEIAVMGLGAEGALLAERGHIRHLPAAHPPRIVSTVGAGDALFSSFMHFYAETGVAAEALRLAHVFAAHKIGVAGAAQGFISAAEVRQVAQV